MNSIAGTQNTICNVQRNFESVKKNCEQTAAVNKEKTKQKVVRPPQRMKKNPINSCNQVSTTVPISMFSGSGCNWEKNIGLNFHEKKYPKNKQFSIFEM